MIVTFRPSIHYTEVYNDERVEAIVDLVLRVQDKRNRSVFILLIQGIGGLHVYDTESWSDWAKRAIKAYARSDELKRAITLLYRLKIELEDQGEKYLSAIVPRYILRKLDRNVGGNSANDVYVRIEKETPGGQCIWDSSERRGSDTVDAAAWNNLNQVGACYECKLGASLKQDQINLLCCIWEKSDHRMEVGLASFENSSIMNKRLLDFEVPSFLKIVTRDSMFDSWPL